MRTVLARGVLERRKGLIGWSIGLFAFAAFNLAFWPAIRDNPEWEKLLEDIPESLKPFIGEASITTPAGYLDSQMFLYLIPVLFAIIVIGRSADGIAGEERRGSLDVLLSLPVTRARVIVEKFAATAASLAIPAAALFVALWAGGQIFGLHIAVARLVDGVVGSMLLALVFGALALAIAAGTGKKGLAIGIAAAVMTASWMVNSLAPQVDSLEPFRKLSPFYYYAANTPLLNGLPGLHVAVLIGLSGLLVWVAVWLFDRRDIATGG